MDEIQLRMGTIDIINDYVIQDSELLSYRIHRVINKSLEEFND